MRWHAAVVLGLVLFGSARGSGDEPPAAPAAPDRSVIVGTHVEASGDVPAAILEEAASLGDQLVPLLAAHFEADVPKAARPLRVVIHATEEGFREAVRAEGATKEDLSHAGGYTPRKTLVSHLWLQAEPFDTRRLVLHELTHQVQDKTFAEFGPGTDTEWHREGLAEHFGWHVRGKNGLEVGRIDALARNTMTWDIGFFAASGSMDYWKIATGKVQADYPVSLALVHALLSTSDLALHEQFRRWEREAWRRRDAYERFEALFDRPALADALRANWRLRKWPWEIRLGQWDEDGGRITGQAEGTGVVVAGRIPQIEVNTNPGRWLGHAMTRARLLGGGTGTAGVQVGFGYGPLQSVVGFGERLLRLERGSETITLRLLTPKELVVLRTWSVPPKEQSAAWSLELKHLNVGILATVQGDPAQQELVPLERLLAGIDPRPGRDPKAALETPTEIWAHMWFRGALYVRAGKRTFEDVTLAH